MFRSHLVSERVNYQGAFGGPQAVDIAETTEVLGTTFIIFYFLEAALKQQQFLSILERSPVFSRGLIAAVIVTQC